MKMLISDLDGTLYPLCFERFEENAEAVRRWVKQGNLFVAASARGLHHYEVLCQRLGFAVDFIGANGAEVRYKNGETVEYTMPFQIFLDLHHFLCENEPDASCCTGLTDIWGWPSDDCYPLRKNETELPWKKEVDLERFRTNITVIDVETVDPATPIQTIQIHVMPSKAEALMKKIEALGLPIAMAMSDLGLINVSCAVVSKAESVQEMCRRYKIDRESLVVAGDGENDISMFALTENSYCIDHAEKAVQESAAHCVPSLKAAIERELAVDSVS